MQFIERLVGFDLSNEPVYTTDNYGRVFRIMDANLFPTDDRDNEETCVLGAYFNGDRAHMDINALYAPGWPVLRNLDDILKTP